MADDFMGTSYTDLFGSLVTAWAFARVGVLDV